MTPRRRCSIDWLSTSRVHSIAAVTSTAIVAFQLSRVCSQIQRSVPGAAALLHRMSTWPNSSTARATMAATSSSSVTSARIAMAPLPAAAAASRTSSSRRAASSTRAPSRTNTEPRTGPSPVLAPVMIATLPANRPVITQILLSGCLVAAAGYRVDSNDARIVF